MSSLSLRIPDSLHENLRQLAKKDHISINQFIASAVAEKISAMETEEYLSHRSARADLEEYKAVLAKVSDREPDAEDRLPE